MKPQGGHFLPRVSSDRRHVSERSAERLHLPRVASERGRSSPFLTEVAGGTSPRRAAGRSSSPPSPGDSPDRALLGGIHPLVDSSNRAIRKTENKAGKVDPSQSLANRGQVVRKPSILGMMKLKTMLKGKLGNVRQQMQQQHELETPEVFAKNLSSAVSSIHDTLARHQQFRPGEAKKGARKGGALEEDVDDETLTSNEMRKRLRKYRYCRSLEEDLPPLPTLAEFEGLTRSQSDPSLRSSQRSKYSSSKQAFDPDCLLALDKEGRRQLIRKKKLVEKEKRDRMKRQTETLYLERRATILAGIHAREDQVVCHKEQRAVKTAIANPALLFACQWTSIIACMCGVAKLQSRMEIYKTPREELMDMIRTYPQML